MIADLLYHRFQKALGCLLALALLFPSLARSEDYPGQDKIKPFPINGMPFRRYMNDKGILLETINTIDVLGTVSGGLRQRTAAAGNFDILLTLDGK